jgi:adenine-specific DNA methylase
LSKPAPSYQKLRGGYYTPEPIADFLARWAIQSSTAEVLEPSCGDGVILESAFKSLIEKGARRKQAAEFLHGVEIDKNEGRKAAERIKALGGKPSMFLIHTGDFFAYCKAHLNDKRLFDAVIGNPPSIRYQNFLEDDVVAAAFLNSLTFAFAEVVGRSYGGGVLELEPNEAEKLPLPLKGAEKLDLKQIHKLLLNNDIESVLDMTDKALLFDGLGLSHKEVEMLRGIWQKLRDRRINRKHASKNSIS